MIEGQKIKIGQKQLKQMMFEFKLKDIKKIIKNKLNEVNIKIAEKNEKVATQIAKSDITKVTINNVTTGLINNTANMIGLAAKPIVNIPTASVDKNAQKEALKIVKEIQKDKSAEINRKRKPRVVRINQFLMDSAIIEAKSFLADHALNDQKTVDARLKNVLEYKNNNTNLIKQNIIENLDKKNIKNVENIVKTIIKDRNKLIRLRRHLNAKKIVNRLLPLQKNKNTSEINKLVNELSKNDVIRMDIKNSLEKNKLDVLQKLLEAEVKKTKPEYEFKCYKTIKGEKPDLSNALTLEQAREHSSKGSQQMKSSEQARVESIRKVSQNKSSKETKPAFNSSYSSIGI
jgi:hypothetical protein